MAYAGGTSQAFSSRGAGKGDVMGENVKGNGKVEVPGEVLDLVRSLKYLSDSEGVHYLLDRVETLSRLIDEIAENENLAHLENAIVDMAYWQRKILGEIRTQLNGQDRVIMALKRRALSENETKTDRETFKPDSEKLEALRQLSNLFVYDNLLYGDSTGMQDLKAWALTYDYDLETVKGLLEKPAEDIH